MQRDVMHDLLHGVYAKQFMQHKTATIQSNPALFYLRESVENLTRHMDTYSAVVAGTQPLRCVTFAAGKARCSQLENSANQSFTPLCM
jgi:hypothetical protein